MQFKKNNTSVSAEYYNKDQLNKYVCPKCENIPADAVQTSCCCGHRLCHDCSLAAQTRLRSTQMTVGGGSGQRDYHDCSDELFQKLESESGTPLFLKPDCGEELTSEDGSPFRNEISRSSALFVPGTTFKYQSHIADCPNGCNETELPVTMYSFPKDIITTPKGQKKTSRIFSGVDEEELVLKTEDDVYQEAIQLTTCANDEYSSEWSICDTKPLKIEQMKELECLSCNEAILATEYQTHNCSMTILNLNSYPLKEHGYKEGSEMSREECLNHLTSKQGIYNHILMIATVLSSFVTSSTSTSSVEVDGNLVESDSGQHTAKLRSASPSRRRVDADGPNGPNDFGFLPDHVQGAVGGSYGGGDGMGNVMSLVMSKITGIQAEMTKKESMIHTLQDKVAHLESTLSSKQNENEDRDFRLSLMANSNFDGSMVWKIPQFSQRMDDARTGKYTSIFSLPFYSSRYGYKMCLRLYILGDGIGKGTHMSLFFVVMKGEFDNILQWPFTHKVTFKLINQCGSRDVMDIFQPDPLSSSFQKPKSDMNVASGCPRFVSMNELMQGGFIVDDTIFIKVKVDTATMHPP